MGNKVFYVLLISFIGGVAFASFVSINIIFTLCSVCLSLAYCCYSLFVQKKFSLVSLAIIFCFLGICRYQISEHNVASDSLNIYVGTPVELQGIISDEPDVREDRTQLTLKLPTSEKILISTGLYPRYEYGDEIVVKGTLQKPKNFSEDGGREFDYVSYLAKDGIYYQMFRPEIELGSRGNGSLIKSKLFAFKHAFMTRIRAVIPEPQASLVGGLILGAKQSLGKDLQDKFRTTGVIHIVVLSGYNITIVAEFVMGLLSFLPAIVGISFGSLSIILFALMTGASATTVRACIMSLLVILARATGRTYHVSRALALAGLVMILHNPKILVFDPSFHLSFMATFGLIVVSPIVEQYLSFIPEKFQLRSLVVATVTTQLFLLPILLYKTGVFSMVALPVNLLILAFIPITMLFGFLTGAMGFMSTLLAFPFGFVAHILLSYELFIVRWFASLPFASVTVSSIPLIIVIVWYVGYGVFILRRLRNSSQSHSSLDS